jgi:hypothetical protein
MLHGAYPFLFGAEDFDLQAASEKHFREQFEIGGATGDTVRKCAAFFVSAAKDADVALSPYIASRKERGASKSPRARKIKSGGRKRENGTQIQPLAEPSLGWAQMLLAKFPSFDPAWPDDVKAKWFDGFERLMGMQDGEGSEASE